MIIVLIITGCKNDNSDKSKDTSVVNNGLQNWDIKVCENCCNAVFDSLSFPIRSSAKDLLNTYSAQCDTIISKNTRDPSDIDTLYKICTDQLEVQIFRTNGILGYDYAEIKTNQIHLFDHLKIGVTREEYFKDRYNIVNCKKPNIYLFSTMSGFSGAEYVFKDGIFAKCTFTTSNPHEILDCK